MANLVYEVLVTEGQLNAPESRVDLAAGATVDFKGIVRGSEDGREIEGIDYEAHREMAEHQLRQIAEQAAIEFGVRSVTIHHRIGFVAVGEPSLFTRVSSGHREAAFQASRWIVEELKKKVPIWKRPKFIGDVLAGISDAGSEHCTSRRTSTGTEPSVPAKIKAARAK
jgi:molybdopterin synthase catalytic subunit